MRCYGSEGHPLALYVYIYLYLDKGPQGLRVRWDTLGDLGALNFTAIYYTSATWGTSTLLLFVILWPLVAFRDLQLYYYLLYFSYFGCHRGPEVVQGGF